MMVFPFPAPMGKSGIKLYKRRGMSCIPRLSLSKKCKCVRSRARASQSSVVGRRRKEVKSVFSGDMCVGKNTAQPASVRAKRVRRSGLQPFEHVLARAREPVDFVDRLRRGMSCIPRLSLTKKCKYVRYYARASQSSVVRRRRKKVKSVFSGDMCVGKNASQPASVRAKRVRRRRLHPFEHVLARAREPVEKVQRKLGFFVCKR